MQFCKVTLNTFGFTSMQQRIYCNVCIFIYNIKNNVIQVFDRLQNLVKTERYNYNTRQCDKFVINYR